MFNNIRVWLNHFDDGTISLEQLQYVLLMRTNSLNPDFADITSSATLCAIYGIHIPVQSGKVVARCAHYLDNAHWHCLMPSSEAQRLVCKRRIKEIEREEILCGRVCGRVCMKQCW